MPYRAVVLADSISEDNYRLTTMEVEFPRIILAEFNTHRMLSRNSASSRAIPTRKQLLKMINEPFMPTEFGKDQGGMQAAEALTGAKHKSAEEIWHTANVNAVYEALKLLTSEKYIEESWEAWNENDEDFGRYVLDFAKRLEKKDPAITDRSDRLNVNKGIVNRLLEPFMWHTAIVSWTTAMNFFALRTDKAAQLEIRRPATEMQQAFEASEPRLVQEGEWHLPFLQPEEAQRAIEQPEEMRMACAARCARVSYLTHDTGVADLKKDVELANFLAKRGHMSPFEHIATPFSTEQWYVRREAQGTVLEKADALSDQEIMQIHTSLEYNGNFQGWTQLRKTMPHEDDFSQVEVVEEVAAA